MKKGIRIFAAIAVVFVLASCKKYSSGNMIYPAAERKIRFELYTNQDFSGDASVINFSIFALASMRIQDIPDALHKLVFEKTVNDNYDLAAGFRYEIHDVGTSAFIDTSKAGNPFKIIDYSFQ